MEQDMRESRTLVNLVCRRTVACLSLAGEYPGEPKYGGKDVLLDIAERIRESHLSCLGQKACDGDGWFHQPLLSSKDITLDEVEKNYIREAGQ